MLNSNPSINPANEDSLTGTFRHVFNKLLQDVNGMLPAKVIAFDRTTNLVQVQPLIMLVTTGGTVVPRAQVASIPVLQIGGGNFMLNFNLVPGDLGWIMASDRDISNFLQSYAQASPNTFRKNNFADSLFVPNIMTKYTIADEDTENAVFQSLDGTVKITLSNTKITLSAPQIEITSDDVNITSSAPIVMTAPLFAVSGNITAGGTITPGVPPPP